MNASRPHRLSAGALVEQDGRLLLVRHRKPGAYDFWVAPGGGVQGDETLEQAACREAREETGVDIVPGRLAYIEELVSPDLRMCKFWFVGQAVGGALSVDHPEAKREHIVEAAWLSPREMEGKQVFPPVVAGRYWDDRQNPHAWPARLDLRPMEFW